MASAQYDQSHLPAAVGCGTVVHELVAVVCAVWQPHVLPCRLHSDGLAFLCIIKPAFLSPQLVELCRFWFLSDVPWMTALACACCASTSAYVGHCFCGLHFIDQQQAMQFDLMSC